MKIDTDFQDNNKHLQISPLDENGNLIRGVKEVDLSTLKAIAAKIREDGRFLVENGEVVYHEISVHKVEFSKKKESNYVVGSGESSYIYEIVSVESPKNP